MPVLHDNHVAQRAVTALPTHKPPDQYAPGRQCVDCGHELSIYNGDDVCAPCWETTRRSLLLDDFIDYDRLMRLGY